MLNQEIVNDFIINTVLISPIDEIIEKLNMGDFRDCDIKWLDDRLEKYIRFAAETLGVKVPSLPESSHYPCFNQHNSNIYLEKFNILLNYFTYLSNDEGTI